MKIDNLADDTHYTLADLRYLMSRLRDSETGCPWDIKQNFNSIISCTLEEVYEVVDAIETEDPEQLKEELGDLLFQIIFYSQLGQEQNLFDFDDIISLITTKLLRRHPHVFPLGTLTSVRDTKEAVNADTINQSWEAIKQQERTKKGASQIFDDIPLALPALTRAVKLQKRASTVGFDWPSIVLVVAKINEEIEELNTEMAEGDEDSIVEELGDIMFSCVNLARHLKRDPETVMRHANRKFQRRFQTMQSFLGDQDFDQLSDHQMESLWTQVKQAEQ
jgi:ATP diphosphatase